MTEVSNMPAAHTNSMDLGNKFSACHQAWHRTKRHTPEVHVETRNNYPDTHVGQFVANFNEIFIEKLRLINSDYINIA